MQQTKRREQIIQAAIETIAELGYAQASVGQIAKRAGISKGVFTYHFASKDEMMVQIVHEVYGKAARFMASRLEGLTNPTDMLKGYIESNLAFIGAHREHIAAVIEIVTNARTPDGRLRFADSSEDSIEAPLIEILKWGEAAGEFRPFTERSARVAAAAIRSAIDGVGGRVASNPELDIAGMSEDLASLFLSAVIQPTVSSEPAEKGGNNG